MTSLPALVEWRHQRYPQTPGELRCGGARRAGEFCKIHSALTGEHSASSLAQRAGFSSPSDWPGCVRSRMCLCSLEVKHVSHFCPFKASFDAACCSPLHPIETPGFRLEWSLSEFLIMDSGIY